MFSPGLMIPGVRTLPAAVGGGGGTNGWPVLSSLTAASDSALEFELPGTYTTYALHIKNLTQSDSGAGHAIGVQFKIGGAYVTTGYSNSMGTETDKAVVARSFAGGDFLDGMVLLVNPEITTAYKTAIGDKMIWRNASGNPTSIVDVHGGYLNNSGAVTHVKLIPDSGTISAGDVDLLGVVE